MESLLLMTTPPELASPLRHRAWHDMLDLILDSGNRIAIDAVRSNLKLMERFVRTITTGGIMDAKSQKGTGTARNPGSSRKRGRPPTEG